MDIRPNHTIYINNVNDKIKKDGKTASDFFPTVPGKAQASQAILKAAGQSVDKLYSTTLVTTTIADQV